MELNLGESKKIKVIFRGADYFMTKPKMGAVMVLEENIEKSKADKNGGTKVLVEFLHSCGLPKEVLSELDSEQVGEIVKVLMPEKKS